MRESLVSSSASSSISGNTMWHLSSGTLNNNNVSLQSLMPANRTHFMSSALPLYVFFLNCMAASV